MPFIENAAARIGAKHVLTGPDAAGLSQDWTGAYQWTPLCVLRPGTTGEVSALMALAHETGTPVVPVSGNTGLSGGTRADGAAMLSLDRLNRIREIRTKARLAIVEAGVVVETLRDAAAEQGLVFPVSFGAQGSALIGGILSTNAGGSNVLRYGNTRAQVLGVEVVLADGRVMDLMSELHKDNTGYDLRDLVIGAEGTLGIITTAVLKLVPAPQTHATAMIAPRDLDTALALLGRLQTTSGGLVEAFEYMPRDYIETHVARVPGAREPFDAPHAVNVMVEMAGPGDVGGMLEAELAGALERGEIADATIAQNDTQRREIWARREAAAEIAFARSPRVTTDIALPLDRLSSFFDRVRAVLGDLDPGVTDTCVAHLGDGNIHFVVYPTRDDPVLADAVVQAVEGVVGDLGGSFSAEHGIGTSKLPSMRRLKNPVALDVMRGVKAAMDPKGILNPGKLLP